MELQFSIIRLADGMFFAENGSWTAEAYNGMSFGVMREAKFLIDLLKLKGCEVELTAVIE